MPSRRWIAWYLLCLVGAAVAWPVLSVIDECSGDCNIGGDIFYIVFALFLLAGAFVSYMIAMDQPSARREDRRRAYLFLALTLAAAIGVGVLIPYVLITIA